jgi:hypothetical protein
MLGTTCSSSLAFHGTNGKQQGKNGKQQGKSTYVKKDSIFMRTDEQTTLK